MDAPCQKQQGLIPKILPPPMNELMAEDHFQFFLCISLMGQVNLRLYQPHGHGRFQSGADGQARSFFPCRFGIRCQRFRRRGFLPPLQHPLQPIGGCCCAQQKKGHARQPEAKGQLQGRKSGQRVFNGFFHRRFRSLRQNNGRFRSFCGGVRRILPKGHRGPFQHGFPGNFQLNGSRFHRQR